MTTHTLSQTLTSVRQTIGRYAWWLGLSLLLLVAALAAYRSVSAPAVSAPAPASMSSTQRTASVDPATQSVLDYLRAHSTVQPLPTPAAQLDPAQQGVMDYLRAHDRVDQPRAPWDPVVQAVLDYLRAHNK